MARRRGNYYPPYVPVSLRRNKNRNIVKSLIKDGHEPRPVVVTGKGRKIAQSFWGHAWCTHISSFSDYSNRLPRGRSYLRHRAVVDLQIEPGEVNGIVSGTDLYSVCIKIKTLDDAPWQKIRQACSGQVGSLLELLQGKLSNDVMTIVTDPDTGLLPKSAEISFNCSCPDWAIMCKHVAAVLFGVGVRLDEEPQLLFLLRGVDPDELITGNLVLPAGEFADADAELAEADLESIFGIELDELPVVPYREAEPSPPAQDPAPTPEAHPSGFEPTGCAIASLRRDFGYSRDEFADIMDVSVASIVRWESAAGRVGMRDLFRRRLEHIFAIRCELLEATAETAPDPVQPAAPSDLIKEIQATIKMITFLDYPDEDVDLQPAFSLIRSLLSELNRGGFFEDTITLGWEFLDKARVFLESGYADYYHRWEWDKSLIPFATALVKNRKSDPETYWAVFSCLQEDFFDLADPLVKYLDTRRKKTDWAVISDFLLQKLAETRPQPSGQSQTWTLFKRKTLTGRILACLELAGRSESIAEVLIREIPYSEDYLGLANHFAKNQQLDEAIRWIEIGISRSRIPGRLENDGLWNLFDSILRRRRMWSRVMTLRVEKFVIHPTTDRFRECLIVARRLKCETEVRDLLLGFLENGTAPWDCDWWTFPASGLALEFFSKQDQFPRLQNLLEIALMEKQEAEILDLCCRMVTHRFPPFRRSGQQGCRRPEEHGS